MTSLVLDTHVLLWSLLEPEEISKTIKQKITAAQNNNKLVISSISLWEIAMLSHKKRINIYEPIKNFLDSITDIDGLVVKDIDSEIAAESTLLTDFHGDPADRIIVATTKTLGATLLTRDQKILSFAKDGYIKYLKS